MIGELKLLTRSYNTEKTYLKGLRQFFRHFDIEDPDAFIESIKSGGKDANEVYRDFVVKLASSNLAPKSVAAWSASLKKFFSSNGIEITRKVPIKIYNVHEDSLPSREELKKTMEKCNLKARVCIALMSASGLRIGELHQLKMGDVDMEKDPATIKIRAIGAKERKGRITFVGGQAKKILEEYIASRKSRNASDPLITTDDEKPMTYQNMQFILNNALRKFSQKEGKRFKLHPHSLRKWFKTQLIAAGVPGPIVDRLTGHSRYLAQEYELYTEEQLRDWYSKGMQNLEI
jgi:site-specific recombinase XerD